MKKPDPTWQRTNATSYTFDLAHATIRSCRLVCGKVVLMSVDRSSQAPGGFQVRHRTLGIYQGSAIQLAFWHPSSGMPEHGLWRFSTSDKAQALIDFLCSPMCDEPMNRSDLSIEPFDLAEHERLVTEHPLPSAWETPI